jgi:YD repeat-containing protein
VQKVVAILVFLFGLGLAGISQYPPKENFQGDVQKVSCRQVIKKDDIVIEYGWEYDEQGRELLTWSPYFFDTGTIYIYAFYDSSDLFTYDLWMWGKDTSAYDIYSYDEHNRLTGIMQYSGQLGWYGEHLYDYNEAGLESLHIWITKGQDTIFYGKNYDEHGRCVTETEEAAGYFRTTTYTYDEAGKKVAEKMEDEDNSKMNYSVVMTYDEDGNKLTSLGYDYQGSLSYCYWYAYNESGDLISETSSDDTGKPLLTETYSYEYDATGNWIVQTTKKGRRTTMVTYREFVYY